MIGILVPVSYIYRYNIFIYFIKGYIYFYGIGNKPNKITHNKFIKIDNISDDSIYIHEFYCHNKKDLNIISNNTKIQKYIIDDVTYELRNKIVHCSLQNEQSEILLDLTNIFRKFVFYFDKDVEYSKLVYFFKYVENVYNIQNVDLLYFVVYKNDTSFTETKYRISDILEKNYNFVL